MVFLNAPTASNAFAIFRRSLYRRAIQAGHRQVIGFILSASLILAISAIPRSMAPPGARVSYILSLSILKEANMPDQQLEQLKSKYQSVLNLMNQLWRATA
jgi:hypothetical protein